MARSASSSVSVAVERAVEENAMHALTRRRMLTVAGLAVAAAWLAGVGPHAQSQVPSPAERPNVVLIITDDVGYGDIGSYGAPDIKTPRIDRLAAEGVRLTDFYAMPVCTPTRAMLITGRYPQRVALERPIQVNAQAFEQGL